MEDMKQQQDKKKRWARLSFGASILTFVVGIIFIAIRKTRSENDGIDTTLPEREYTVGRADRSIEELDIETPERVPDSYPYFGHFVSHYDSPIEFTEYALSYADAYMVFDETHWMINRVANTSTSVYDDGDVLYVTVYEYIEDEEMDVETLGKGTRLFYYSIYKDNGDIVDSAVKIAEIYGDLGPRHGN